MLGEVGWSLVFVNKTAASSGVLKYFFVWWSNFLQLAETLPPCIPPPFHPQPLPSLHYQHQFAKTDPLRSPRQCVHKPKSPLFLLPHPFPFLHRCCSGVVALSSGSIWSLFANVLMEAHPAVRKEERKTEGRGERNEQKRRGGGGGISSWFKSAVVSIRQLRCCETRCWGGVWTKKGGGGLKIKHPTLLWLLVWCRIRCTLGAQQENGFL